MGGSCRSVRSKAIDIIRTLFNDLLSLLIVFPGLGSLRSSLVDLVGLVFKLHCDSSLLPSTIRAILKLLVVSTLESRLHLLAVLEGIHRAYTTVFGADRVGALGSFVEVVKLVVNGHFLPFSSDLAVLRCASTGSKLPRSYTELLSQVTMRFLLIEGSCELADSQYAILILLGQLLICIETRDLVGNQRVMAGSTLLRPVDLSHIANTVLLDKALASPWFGK